MLCMPVHKYREALNEIANYISENTIIGTVYDKVDLILWLMRLKININ